MTIEYYNLKETKPTKGYPVSHKRKVPFMPSLEVPPNYFQRTRRIKELDFELDRFILTAEDYQNIVVEAYSSNVHWSTKIEGNPLSEDEVRRITRNTFIHGPKEKPSGPRQEIINHLTHLLFPEGFKLPWTHSHIQAVHDYLLEGTGAKFTSFAYRTSRASVYDTKGMEVLKPCPPEHISEEMSSLLDWVNGPAIALDSIVRATVFFHEFESIHPFDDGNGRTGRSLFHLLLQDSDLPNSNLCKIESHLLSDSETYYQILAYTDESGSYEELIDLVSAAILSSYEDAQKALLEKDLLSSDLDEVTRRLLKRAKRLDDWFSIHDAVEWVSKVGSYTVNKKLNHLTEIGALQMRGNTQSRRYKFLNPLEDFRAAITKERDKNLPDTTRKSTPEQEKAKSPDN
jgi:Fic family protein